MNSLPPRILLLAALCSFGVGQAQAQPEVQTPTPPTPPLVIPKEPIIDPTAKALVEATMAKYKAMKSYSDHMAVTGLGMNSEAKIAWERPSKARAEGKVGDKNTFGLNDGKTLWVINPRYPGYYVQRNAETNRIFDAFGESDANGPGGMITSGDTPFSDFIRDGLYKLEMGLPDEFDGKPMQVVRAHFAFDDGHNSLMSLFIGQKDGLLYRISQSIEGAGSVEEVHHDIKVNPILPPETWQWTPPADLKKTEYFSSLKPDVLSTYKPGQKLPSISSPDLNGKTVNLSDFKGKSLMLYFLTFSWGDAAIRDLTDIQARAGGPDKLAIVCVSLDGRRDRLEDFVKKNNFPYPILFDGQGWHNVVSQALGVNSHPIYFLIDKDGVIQHIGRNSQEVDFDDKMNVLLP